MRIIALGRLWRWLQELPLIAPGWTCRVTFQLKPHRHRYRENRDFGWVPGSALVAPACGTRVKKKKWTAWEVGVEVKVHVSLGRRVCRGVSRCASCATFRANLPFIWREYFATIFSVIFNSGAVWVCSPPLGSPLIQWLFAPGRAGVGTEHPEPRFFWISTWKASVLPPITLRYLWKRCSILLLLFLIKVLDMLSTVQLLRSAEKKGGKARTNDVESHSPSPADSGPGLVRWWSSSYHWASS